MALETFNDVHAFAHLVREASFTRASALLVITPSR